MTTKQAIEAELRKNEILLTKTNESLWSSPTCSSTKAAVKQAQRETKNNHHESPFPTNLTSQKPSCVPHLGIMQKSQANYSILSKRGGAGEKGKVANNDDIGELLQNTQKSKGKKGGLTVHQNRMKRSKQLKETSELICISSALNKPTPSTSTTKRSKHKTITAANTLSPAENLGIKSQCNYIRQFRPLGRYFGVTTTKGVNPLMKSKVRSSNESLLSFKDEEFGHTQEGDFLSHARFPNQKAKITTHHQENNNDSLMQGPSQDSKQTLQPSDASPTCIFDSSTRRKIVITQGNRTPSQ